MKMLTLISRAALGTLAVAATGVGFAQVAPAPQPLRPALAASTALPLTNTVGAAGITRLQRGMTVAQLLALPDAQVLEAPNGKRITVAEFRQLVDKRRQAQQKEDAAPDGPEVAKGRIALDLPSNALNKKAAAALVKAQQASSLSRHAPLTALPSTSADGGALAAGAGKLVDLGAPRIYHVSGQPVSQTWFIPGVGYDIRGQGFGNTPGQVLLLGQFPGGQPHFRIDLWSDTQIFATFAPDLSGVADQNEVALVVQPPQKAPIQSPHGHFYAARADLVLDMPRAKASLASSATAASYKHEDGWTSVRRQAHSAPEWSDVWGDDYNTPLSGCGMQPATDHFDLSGLRSDFAVVGFEWYHDRTDSGPGSASGYENGYRFFSPGYAANSGSDWRSLDISWGVFKSYIDFPSPPTPDVWSCRSKYRFRITVQGPRGLSPWQ